MKLFIYDEKHEQVNGTLPLGDLNENEVVMLQKIVSFLAEKGITDRYKNLIVASGYSVKHGEEDNEVQFHCVLVS